MTTQFNPTTPYPQQPAGAYPPPPQAYPSVPQFKVPGVGPVVAFTAIFGLFGAISAARRSSKARNAGFPTNKYWVTFGITLAVVWAVGGIIGAMTSMGAAKSATQPVTAAPAAAASAPAASAPAVPAKEVVAVVEPTEESAVEVDALDAAWLQESITESGNFRNADGSDAEVDSATCSAVDVDEAGAGSYQCVIDFVSGERQSQNIIVDPSGAWVTNA
ncbi:hypothetical protein [Actinoplanes sp. CA-252034]|uniref:hypothetical protein n=1 Tax=Actinoplanes sp. CA-252034 TaxID=3239906 RepID=UPI003D977666